MTRVVRQATVDDRWAVHETARESWHAAYDDVLGPETVDYVVDEWYALTDLESSIAAATGRKDAAFLVAATASTDGADCRSVDGFAHVVPWPENTAVAFLACVYVRPAVWNAGLGTTLLETIERRCAAAFGRLRLAVLAANEIGVSFSESRGFDRVETRPSQLAAGLEEHVYEKRLSDVDG